MPKKILLLLHGALLNSSYWQHCKSMFAPFYSYILAPNIWGHDQAQDGPARYFCPQLTVEFLASDILRKTSLNQFIDSYKIDIVGHSLGGLIALDLASRLVANNPRHPLRVILGDSPIYMSNTLKSHSMAKDALMRTSLGKNLLVNSFLNFESTHHSFYAYEQKLISTAHVLKVILFAGMLGANTNCAQSVDCGTFISPDQRERLLVLADGSFDIHEIYDAGHFVFDSYYGRRLLSLLLTENQQS